MHTHSLAGGTHSTHRTQTHSEAIIARIEVVCGTRPVRLSHRDTWMNSIHYSSIAIIQTPETEHKKKFVAKNIRWKGWIEHTMEVTVCGPYARLKTHTKIGLYVIKRYTFKFNMALLFRLFFIPVISGVRNWPDIEKQLTRAIQNNIHYALHTKFCIWEGDWKMTPSARWQMWCNLHEIAQISIYLLPAEASTLEWWCGCCCWCYCHSELMVFWLKQCEIFRCECFFPSPNGGAECVDFIRLRWFFVLRFSGSQMALADRISRGLLTTTTSDMTGYEPHACVRKQVFFLLLQWLPCPPSSTLSCEHFAMAAERR